MTDHGQSAEGLHHYVEILRRHKWLILGSLVIIPAVVLAISLLQPTRYSATARVMAQSQSPSVSVAVGTNLGLSGPDERELQTLASFVVTREIAGRAAEEINWSGQSATLMEDVTAESDPAADVINVTAVRPTPEGAARVANAFASQFLLWRQESLQKSLDEAIDRITEQVGLAAPGSAERATLVERRGQLEVLKPLVSGGLTIGEAAQPPLAPSSPQPLRNTALALAAGLVFGLGIAFLRDSLDVRLHDSKEIAEHTSLPIVAEVPELRRHEYNAARVVVLDDPRSPHAEAYRFLRANVDFINFNSDVKVIVVSSPAPSQGKSTTIANLAVALLRAGRRVAVVDGDLRRPSLHRFFQVGNARGVTDVVAGAATLADATQTITLDGRTRMPAAASAPSKVRITTAAESKARAGAGRPKTSSVADEQDAPRELKLLLLTSGAVPPNPGEIVGSKQFGRILRELGERADYVLVDAPPMFAVGDSAAMAPWVDGLLVVLHLRDTTAETVKRVGDFFTRTPTRALGIVVTGVPTATRGGYYYASE